MVQLLSHTQFLCPHFVRISISTNCGGQCFLLSRHRSNNSPPELELAPAAVATRAGITFFKYMCWVSIRLKKAFYIHGRTVFPTHFSLAEILVLDGTTGAGGMAPPASTRISATMKCVQGHVSAVNDIVCSSINHSNMLFLRALWSLCGPLR